MLGKARRTTDGWINGVERDVGYFFTGSFSGQVIL